MVTAGIFPFKENSHGRAGNRTRDLMISSQRLWPLDHEAGPFTFDIGSPKNSSPKIRGPQIPSMYYMLTYNMRNCVIFPKIFYWQVGWELARHGKTLPPSALEPNPAISKRYFLPTSKTHFPHDLPLSRCYRLPSHGYRLHEAQAKWL